MADDWKSCENCGDTRCRNFMEEHGLLYGPICGEWQPIRCRCGGALSTTRVHNGRRYRHCYSCHFEFYEEG